MPKTSFLTLTSRAFRFLFTRITANLRGYSQKQTHFQELKFVDEHAVAVEALHHFGAHITSAQYKDEEYEWIRVEKK